MEDERHKSLAPPSMALVAREVSLRAKGPFEANRPRKVNMPLKTPDVGLVLPRSKKTRSMEIRV